MQLVHRVDWAKSVILRQPHSLLTHPSDAGYRSGERGDCSRDGMIPEDVACTILISEKTFWLSPCAAKLDN